MIKLSKGDAPLFLDQDKIDHLTEKFKSTGESVWQIEELKSALIGTSFGKCAFCECSLGNESKYMEVEHFRFKKKYPDEVVIWDNLLPSCRRCNGKKLDHDVVIKPIINPYEDIPAIHFTMQDYRLKHKTDVGLESIGVLDLNNSTRVVLSRFKIGEKLHEALIVAEDRLENFKINKTTRARNKFTNILEKLLLEAQPEAEYAATTATLLHKDKIYARIVTEAKINGLWSAELDKLHVRSLSLIL